jgi:hypothetical protein
MLLAMTLAAQSPAPLLQILQERLYPDAEQAYGKIEEEIARLCARMNCPNRYLALASVKLPIEVRWLNTYASQADVQSVAQGYAQRPALTTAMRELAQGKKGLASEPIDMMTALRRDLSDGSPWLIGELRFAVIQETRTPTKASGAVFQAPDGRAFVLAAASTAMRPADSPAPSVAMPGYSKCAPNGAFLMTPGLHETGAVEALKGAGYTNPELRLPNL